VIVTDQGAVFSLVCDYVVGREPETAPEVMGGAAMAIALDDPKLAMSRIHTRILLDGWEVRVEDATSANGTFVAHGEGEWTRLEPGLPTTVTPGPAYVFFINGAKERAPAAALALLGRLD